MDAPDAPPVVAAEGVPPSAVDGIVQRYDLDAPVYDRYWQPVLDGSTRRLLDRLSECVPARTHRHPSPRLVVDVGTGGGVLALAAAERWPGASVLGVDPSRGMLEVARVRASRSGIAEDDGRLSWLKAPGEALPIDDESADLAMSSFVLQLVAERAPVLAEVLRVLRPGGRFAFVTWLDRGPAFLPDAEFDEAVLDLDIGEPEPEPPDPPRAGDYPSLRAAERELRAAGFVRLDVRADELIHAWDPSSYLAFKRHYGERALFEWLDPGLAERLAGRLMDRWAKLPPDTFTFRARLVYAVAHRP